MILKVLGLTPVVKRFTFLLMASSILAGCSTPVKYDNRGVNNGKFGASPSVKKNQTASVKCQGIYKVVKGDTLSRIASRCNINMMKIAEHNYLSPPYLLYVNQELEMPSNQATGAKKSKASQNSDESDESSHSIMSSYVKPSGANASANWLWPMDKGLKSQFIKDSSGLSVLEIYGLPGQSVKSVAAGKVVYAGDGISNFGLMIVIKHADDYMSIYAHNSALLVKEGDAVSASQSIASMGATGNTSQPKLYVEARFQGRKIDIDSLFKK